MLMFRVLDLPCVAGGPRTSRLQRLAESRGRGAPLDEESTGKQEPSGKGRAATVIFNPDGYTWSYGLEDKPGEGGAPKQAAVGVQATAAAVPPAGATEPGVAAPAGQQQASGAGVVRNAAEHGEAPAGASGSEGQHAP